MHHRLAVLLVLVLGAFAFAGEGEGDRAPAARESYKGREIPPAMHHSGAPWLTRPERAEEENTALLMEELGIEEGMTVCDMGCGNGYFTLRMARAVGEEGKVYAVDIQEEMLEKLRRRAEDAGLMDRIEPVLGQVHDPKLPSDEIDLMLMVDVYHEFSHPEHMLGHIRRSLKPDGRLALVEYRMEDDSVPIKRLHKMSKAQIMKELPPNGYRLARAFDGLPWQHLMLFEPDGIVGDGKRKLVADGAKLEAVSAAAPGNGVAIDERGHVYRAKGERVAVWSAGGKKVLTIHAPGEVTGVGFDEGKAGLRLLIAAGGEVYQLALKAGGGG